MKNDSSEFLTYRFEKRAVAFLDVLGFTSLIKDAEKYPAALSKFNGLQATIEHHVRFDNDSIGPGVPKSAHPRYLFISDSIIISAPLDTDGYDGLAIVGLKSLQIAQNLLESGFLMRGALAVGNVLHEKQNIFGTGYISAYKAQEQCFFKGDEKCAYKAQEKESKPHVFMTKEAKKHFDQAQHRNESLDNLGVWVEYDGERIIDVLNPMFLRDGAEKWRWQDYFGQVAALIHQNLQSHPHGSSPHRKWEWMAKYFNFSAQRHGIGNVPIL